MEPMQTTASTKQFKTCTVRQTTADLQCQTFSVNATSTAHSKSGPQLIVDVQAPKQHLVGFGGALNESGAYLLSRLSPDQRTAALSRLFSDTDGAGLNVLGLPLGHNDYSLSCFSYNDNAGDVDMAAFTIERDQRYLIPILREAVEIRRDLLFVARPDYPPQWMLDSDRKLKTEYYDAYARYLVYYCRAYREAGFPIHYISLFNEPLIYTQIQPQEIARLIELSVGPAFERSDCQTRIIGCDSYDRRRAAVEWPVILDAPDARRYTYGMAYHSYHSGLNPGWIVGELHDRYPKIEMWQTEVMNLYTKPVSTPADAQGWAETVIDDLVNGTSGWLFWNLYVDPEGGPWNQDPFNRGYPQDGVVVVNPEGNAWKSTAKLAFFEHFSNSLPPGSLRLGSEPVDPGLPFPENGLYWCRHVAALRPDGSIVAVVVNTGEYEQSFAIVAGTAEAAVTLPPHAIATYLFQ